MTFFLSLFIFTSTQLEDFFSKAAKENMDIFKHGFFVDLNLNLMLATRNKCKNKNNLTVFKFENLND